MRIVNNAGYAFYWPEGSPYIEVFRNAGTEFPFEVVWAGDLEYGPSALNIIAYSSKEYAHA
jgi:hypothetical protein